MNNSNNNFFRGFSLFIIIACIYYFSSSKEPTTTQELSQKEEEVPVIKDTQRIPSSVIHSNKSNKDKNEDTPPKSNLNANMISHVPTFAPSELNNRWSHTINSEDDLYVDTQLNLDDIPLETYNYRWKKDTSGEASELIAGILPQINSVNGNFPGKEEGIRLAEDLVNREGNLLSVKEVWSLDSNKVLSPQLKVEVQVKSRTQESAGHEYWYISVNSGKIVKRTEADRF